MNHMAMTPTDFAVQMRRLATSEEDGLEETHMKADKLMCTILREWGYSEGVDVFEEMDKWYA